MLADLVRAVRKRSGEPATPASTEALRIVDAFAADKKNATVAEAYRCISDLELIQLPEQGKAAYLVDKAIRIAHTALQIVDAQSVVGGHFADAMECVRMDDEMRRELIEIKASVQPRYRGEFPNVGKCM